MSDTPDLGRIINLIMENPKLIEEISNLAKGEGKAAPVARDTVPTEAPRIAEAASAAPSRSRKGRGELISLLKPYLSERRATAIDSMVSIAEVLKMMKRGD